MDPLEVPSAEAIVTVGRVVIFADDAGTTAWWSDEVVVDAGGDEWKGIESCAKRVWAAGGWSPGASVA